MSTYGRGRKPTPYQAATALTMEARRRGLSYGRLVANTTQWEQEEIVSTYLEQKSRRVNRRRKSRRYLVEQ